MSRALADHIVGAVLALARRLRAERPAGGPSLSAIGILSTLRRVGAMPATQLAAEERLQPQSLTRLLAGLERNGWIVRRRNPADRRELSIALTRRGERVLATEVEAREVWLAQAMAAVLRPAERSALLAAAGAMRKLAEYPATRARRRTRRRLSRPARRGAAG